MKKHRGIAIELTALLDVILIMLFWVMMKMKDDNDSIRIKAQEENEEHLRQEEQLRQQLDELNEQYERYEQELSELSERYEQELSKPDPDTVAAFNQKALDDFAQGRMITLNLKYDAVGKLFILDDTKELGRTMITDKEELTESIADILKDSVLSENEVILCAFVYDGSRALYRDVKAVSGALDEITGMYGNIYCTYINISR